MFRIRFPYDEIAQHGREVQAEFIRQRGELLQVLGIQLLSKVKLAFEEKSRGGTGADGIKWKPLTANTLLRRLQKRGAVSGFKTHGGGFRNGQKGTVAKNSKTTKDILRSLETAGAIKINGAGKAGSIKKGTTFTVTNNAKRIDSVNVAGSKKTKTGKPRPSNSSHQIGVDTGLLRNSATPGYKGPDGKGGNVLDVSQHAVTVGFGRTYAEYFDRDRTLIPDPLPDDWMRELEQTVVKWTGDILSKELE